MRSNEASPLYDQLKAFKDIRKRPGLVPDEFGQVMSGLFERIATQIGDEMYATVLMDGICRWLQLYADETPTLDSTLVDRETLMREVLWPSIFSAGARFLLSLHDSFFPILSASALLKADSPFGAYLRQLMNRQHASTKAIATLRADRRQIDIDNAEATVGDWLSGRTVPSLESGMLALEAIGLQHDMGARAWLPVALLLAKTPLEIRRDIHHQLPLGDKPPPPVDLMRHLLRKVSWDIGKQLNIGPDRPYIKLRNELYEPTSSRDPALVEELIGRLEVTWRPIDQNTRHIIEWFRGRHLVLSGRLEEALDHYQIAYDYAAGRGPEVATILNEALAVAGRLGKRRKVNRYLGLIDQCATTDWDRDIESLPAFFDRVFPKELRYANS